MAVVLVLSNSRISGSTSDDKNTGMLGNASLNLLPINASCSSFKNENNNDTATASTRAVLSLEIICSISSSTIGITTWPSASIRSVISKRLRRCTKTEGGS